MATSETLTFCSLTDRRNGPFVQYMRAGSLLVVFVFLSTIRIVAQQQQTQTNRLAAGTNVAELQSKAAMELRLIQPLNTNSSEYVILKRTLRVSGPLARPFKAKTGSGFARGVAHLFSPFTDEINDRTPRYEPVSARAWSTIAGWNPGRSAFPDDTWHEPQLRLITVNVEKQPQP
jgi:hypothetical protein